MIVFFDGVCGLCNSAVDFLLAHDKNGALKFAPLQGETARARLPSSDIENLNSLVIVDGDQVFRKSDGVLHAGTALGGALAFLARTAQLVPRPVRDIVYGVIASNRYALFGKRETCRLPTKDERARFLD